MAERNPRLERLTRSDGEIEMMLCGRRYVLPEEDVLLLPIDNTSTEALAELWVDRLRERLSPALRGSAALGLEVTIEESPGQGAVAYRALD